VREPLHLVFLGLTITSSWGNGHATTFRSLLGALGALGHEVDFLERDVPWYAQNRDEHRPAGCRVLLYDSVAELEERHRELVRDADAVIVGSYVPDGGAVTSWVLSTARGLTLFYDIDTPVTMSRLRGGDESYLRRDSIALLDAYLSFTGGPALAALEQEFGARIALPLYCSVDARLHSSPGVSPVRDLGYLGTYSADRQPSLQRLLLDPAARLPARCFVVAGASYPQQPPFPDNVTRIEHVPPAEHAAFYASQRFTLNLTRADMRRMGYSPSVRLFEAAACGTPIISDRWRGIERFFQPGAEILLADETADVVRLLDGLDESARLELARRARERVLREHTAEHRALELLGYLRELSSGRRGVLRDVTAPERRGRSTSLSEASES
jgi:spore maturation protein CgeB